MSDPTKRDLSKTYEPQSIEPRWYEEWMAKGYFHAEASAPKAPFAIVIPPPNVTGYLHMGHALGTTIEDIFTRWKRMAAYNAMWLPGTDHAGIATQMVVERELREKEGKSRHDIGREEFVKRVWAWRERTGDRILSQLRTMGCSLDWERTKFTMEPAYSAAVIEAFVRLHEEGLIYRARRLINWCPSCRTALSDLEVDYDEGVQGELYEFAYPLADGSGEVIVATTRPETMLGDTAVAVHPDDPRHQAKIGKTIKHPFTGRTFKIIADPVLVDPKFGTGAVKVTPAHDPNDFETGQRHGLPSISIFDQTGAVTLDGEFKGLDRFKARKAVKARLKELGFEAEGPSEVVVACRDGFEVVRPVVVRAAVPLGAVVRELLLDLAVAGRADEVEVLEQVRHPRLAVALVPRAHEIGHVERDLRLGGVRIKEHAEPVREVVLRDAAHRRAFHHARRQGLGGERGPHADDRAGRQHDFSMHMSSALLWQFGVKDLHARVHHKTRIAA